MKISSKDSFDYTQSIGGLGVILTYMHSDLYEYKYYLTFKRSMKSYAKQFNDAWEQSIDHDEFFDDNPDLIVQNCHSAQGKLIDFKQQLILRYSIAEMEDLEDPALIVEAHRYRPFFLLFKRSKSYKKLALYYDRTLESIIESLFLYACAFTAENYRIPLILKRQYKHPEDEWFRLLNHDDPTVELLKGLILDLKKDLLNLQSLVKK